MKNWFRDICVVVLATCASVAMAQSQQQDTVFFYTSWEQIIYQEPEAVVIDPYIEAVTPYEIYFFTPDEKVNASIEENYLAATLGDSVWLVNSACLKEQFKGDAKHLNGFVPVFFNDKVAYIVSNGSPSVKDILFGTDDSYYNGEVNFYYIDFVNRKVLKVTPAVLSSLLEDYHDLQMRYEGMKDFKKRPIIEDFFFKYIDRASQDVMHPYILDLVETHDMPIN